MNANIPNGIVVIDDEPAIRRLARTILESSGIRVFEAEDGASGLAAIAHHQPDLILLDLGLPDLDGKAVLQRLRTWSDAPVIVLTVRDDPTEKIAALDTGADDYVTKPFHSGELLARIRAVSKRRFPSNAEAIIQVANLEVDCLNRSLKVDGQPVTLTPTEFGILQVLARNAGCVLTKQAIIQSVWGSENRGVSEDHLRVHLASLRKKLRLAGTEMTTLIHTEQGVGYRLGI
jgi:two-component system KDP operon response regulator KdpE